MSAVPGNAPYTKHMKVFNGLIGICIMYAVWGNCYFFSYYFVYDNP